LVGLWCGRMCAIGANRIVWVCSAAVAMISSGAGMFSQICEACSEIIMVVKPILSHAIELCTPHSNVCRAVRPGRM